MNSRHDALYSRARVVLNQKIKRLWFKVNPYLEKKNNLDREPESPTRFIQPLQSAIVSEGFFKEDSVDHKHLSIEAFWEFLYSDKWPGGTSVRVMEGQLLEQLMTTLHVLVKSGEAVKHKTFAYARNQRERRGCYKLANQEGCEYIQETLLLEFTYFARRCAPMRSVQSDFSNYPESLTTTGTSTTTSSNYNIQSRIDVHSQLLTHEEIPKTGKKFTKRKRRVSAPDFRQTLPGPISKNKFVSSRPKSNINILEEDEILTVENRMPSGNEDSPDQTRPYTSQLNQIDIVPLSVTYSNQISEASSDSDYRVMGAVTNLNKFRCSEKIVYEDKPYDLAPPRSLLDDTILEEGMYLSDNNIKPQEVDYSAQGRLRRKKMEKDEQKKKEKEFIETWESQRLSANFTYQLSDLSDPSDVQMQFRFLEYVPTFEEFLHILEEDQKYDPRFKRQKQISRKIAKRYNIAKDMIQGNVNENEPPSVSRKKSVSSKLPPITEKTRKLSTASPTSREAVRDLKRSKLQCIKSATYFETSASNVSVEQTAKEVGGVTSSQPCEKHVLDHKEKRQVPIKRESRRLPKQSQAVAEKEKKKVKPVYIPSIYLTSPTGANFMLYQSPQPPPEHMQRSRSSFMKSHKSSERRRSSQLMKSSENAANCPNIEQDSSSESDDGTVLPMELFNARKLNLRYSFERLKGKDYHKKKPVFYNVLRKYYRAQKAVDAFAQSGEDNRSKKAKRKSIFHRLLNPNDSAFYNESEVIGKLKQYNFLMHRKRTRVEVESPPALSNYSITDFRDSVMKALDDFVVRKEHVISDIGAKSSSTITFTRKSVFTQMF